MRGDVGKITFDNDGTDPRQTVAGSKSWTFTISKDVYETTHMGDNSKEFVGGIIQGEGSITILFDANAVAGSGFQMILDDILVDDNHTDARFQLFPSNSSTYSARKLEFIGIVTGLEFGATVGEVQEVTINFLSDGTITNSM